MATYTMELRKVCDYYNREEVENWFKSYNLRDFLREDEIQSIETAGLWNKDRLARKIVDHYFMREIGFETPALFSHYAKVTMQEIMEEITTEIFNMELKNYPENQDINFYQRWITVNQGDNEYYINLAYTSNEKGNRYLCQSQKVCEIIEKYMEDNLI